jgi:citrate synthase
LLYRNGNEGIILYRGHPLGTLVGKSYEEITYLLIWGELPTEKQWVDFQHKIVEAMVVPPNVHQLIASFP